MVEEQYEDEFESYISMEDDDFSPFEAALDDFLRDVIGRDEDALEYWDR